MIRTFCHLYKVKTLEDAEYPQEEKYPSGTIIREGWMYEEPLVGSFFILYGNKIRSSLRTSPVKEVLESSKDHIRFKTLNSEYILIKLYTQNKEEEKENENN